MHSFSGSRSPVGLHHPRRAPYRLAALLTAFRLVYRVLPPSGFHGWHVCQLLHTGEKQDLNLHALSRQGRTPPRLPFRHSPVYCPILTGLRLFRCHQFRSYGSPALLSAIPFKRTQTHGSAPPFARRVGFDMRARICTLHSQVLFKRCPRLDLTLKASTYSATAYQGRLSVLGESVSRLPCVYYT